MAEGEEEAEDEEAEAEVELEPLLAFVDFDEACAGIRSFG